MQLQLLEIDELIGSDPQGEDETDLVTGPTDAVLASTDWTVETLLNQLRRKNIDLSPEFQRREAWTDDKKSAFIESLFLGLPVPQLVLAERKEKRGSYVVIDGKQRLITLRRFAADREGDDFVPLKLKGLRVRPDLNGFSLADLHGSEALRDDLTFFENQTIRTVVVRNWPDESFLYLVFLRLNTGSVPLSPQELRQALHPGPFLEFANRRAGDSAPLRTLLRQSGPDFRMRDVELLIRFFAFRRYLPDYRGNLKSFLDEACLRLNREWIDHEAELRGLADRFDMAISRTLDIFGEHSGRRWLGDRYEYRFNRAVFDVMAYYFGDPRVDARAASRQEAIEAAFKQLCETDPGFVEAVQTTTKSVGATVKRLSAWGQALDQALAPEGLPRDLFIAELL